MEFLEGIPNVLYKYRVWEDSYQKRILTNNELFLASADLFNDPFDASLPFQYDKSELTDENIFKKLLLTGRDYFGSSISEEDLYAYARKELVTGKHKTKEHWDNFQIGYRKSINENFGILSLTSNNDNLLMWAHYANSHKGFCIGFDKFKLYKLIGGVVGRVNYEDNFPIMPMFSNPNSIKLTELITTKSKHWEYEDEYRITKSLASRKIFNFDDSFIKEIIFGCKMEKEIRAEIIQIIKSKPVKIKMLDAVKDDNQFKLNFVEVL